MAFFQARMLEWVAISYSRGYSWPSDQTWVSCIAGRFFTTVPPCVTLANHWMTLNQLSSWGRLGYSLLLFLISGVSFCCPSCCCLLEKLVYHPRDKGRIPKLKCYEKGMKDSRIYAAPNIPLWCKDYFEKHRHWSSSGKKEKVVLLKGKFIFIKKSPCVRVFIYPCQEEQDDPKSQKHVTAEVIHFNLHEKTYPC